MEKLPVAEKCFQDSSGWPSGKTVGSAAGEPCPGWFIPVINPCAVPRAGLELWGHQGLWLWNWSLCPCAHKLVSAAECQWAEHPLECLGKQVLNPSSMGGLQLYQFLLPSILSPIQGLWVFHFARGQRHFQNNLCCFLNKAKSERKQNLIFVIANNDCDRYLLPKIKNHPAVAYGQTELTPKWAWCGWAVQGWCFAQGTACQK